MPSHFAHTPEALLGRNDSKNPATTCRGITSSGRRCRRTLALSKVLQNGHRPSAVFALNGVVTVVEEDGLQEADYYCWQHKDQAQTRMQEAQSMDPSRQRREKTTDLYPLRERSSIDTLVQRLGIDARNEIEATTKRASRHKSAQKPPKRTETQDFAFKAHERPAIAHHSKDTHDPSKTRAPRPKKAGFWELLCCITADEDDYVELVRRRRKSEAGRTRPTPEISAPPPATSGKDPTSMMPARHGLHDGISDDSQPTNWAMKPQGRRPSHTDRLLSFMPPTLSPQTTSAVLAELVKPISPRDEDGYIYIFWLTPQSKQAPGEFTARSLLAPATARPHHARRISDVMTEYSFDSSVPESKGKDVVMLKIGRANNVTRRMNEWQRQCGYELNLVRWYPHVPSSPAPSPLPSPDRNENLYPDLSRPSMQARRQSDVVRKVPFVKRVERLIHLELADKQVKRQCNACGKEHREWFEVAATQAGVRAVDECVKRWVNWAEKHAQ